MMRRGYNNFDLDTDNDLMDVIASYMDDDAREQVHFELAPCSNSEFLERYVELDPEFSELLSSEFGIEL